MILVIGNNPKRVPLKDLNDFVYYKQKKIFSDADYARSRDLQQAIQKGSLTILQQTSEKDGNFQVPETFQSVPVKTAVDTAGTAALIERLKAIEDSLSSIKALGNASSNVSDIEEKLKAFEGRISGSINDQQIAGLTDTVKALEKKLESGLKEDTLLAKLEELLARPRDVSSIQTVPEESTRVEDIYVPEVVVEDANSHVKLDVRTIDSGTGNSLEDSLKKLQEMKKKLK